MLGGIGGRRHRGVGRQRAQFRKHEGGDRVVFAARQSALEFTRQQRARRRRQFRQIGPQPGRRPRPLHCPESITGQARENAAKGVFYPWRR